MPSASVCNQAMSVLIPDKNLWLALLDQVQGNRYWIPTIEAKYEEARKTNSRWPRWSEIAEADDEPSPALEEFLLSQELRLERLRGVKSLTLDGDRNLYEWVFPNWWDLGDHFVIRDLSGIQNCEQLEYLLLGQGVVEACGLGPLRELKQLRELHLCALCGHTDIDAVLDLPNLRRLDVVNIASSAQRADWESVVEAFRAQN